MWLLVCRVGLQPPRNDGIESTTCVVLHLVCHKELLQPLPAVIASVAKQTRGLICSFWLATSAFGLLAMTGQKKRGPEGPRFFLRQTSCSYFGRASSAA